MSQQELESLDRKKIMSVIDEALKEVKKEALNLIYSNIIDILKSKKELIDYINDYSSTIDKHHLVFNSVSRSRFSSIKLHLHKLLPLRITSQLEYLSNGWEYPNKILNNINAIDERKFPITTSELFDRASGFVHLANDRISKYIFYVLEYHNKTILDFITEEDKESLLYNILEYYKVIYYTLYYYTISVPTSKSILNYIKELNNDDFYNFITSNLKLNNNNSIEAELFGKLINTLKFRELPKNTQ